MAFDFKKHLIKVQGGRSYLPVSARIVWFREEHPDWGIETEPIEINHEKQFAVFRARIFNADGKLMAMGTKKEDVKGFRRLYGESRDRLRWPRPGSLRLRHAVLPGTGRSRRRTLRRQPAADRRRRTLWQRKLLLQRQRGERRGRKLWGQRPVHAAARGERPPASARRGFSLRTAATAFSAPGSCSPPR